MKKIIFSLSLIGFLGLTSCQDDFMEYEPTDASDVGTAVTNEGQLQTAVFGVYDALQSNYAYGNYYISAQELMTDNGFVMFDNSNRFTDFYRFTHAQATGGSISNMWTIGYRAIARANFVLSFEGQITGSTVDQNFAEARALRAITLFNLVNYYARPYGTTDQDLGIPVPTELALDIPLARKTVEEVYNEIISELELAAADLGTNSNRFSQQAAYGFLSRVNLYKKDYQKAQEYADLALGQATLLGADDLETYYLDPLSSSETLFAIDFTAFDNPNSNDALNATWSIGGTYEDTAATTDFFNLIADTDARKDLYVELESADNPLPYAVKKFGPVDNDVVVIRATEVLLNKIEAMYYTNQATALAELNEWVSTYRDASYSFAGTGQDLLDEILEQRRIELAFEGHRYFDLNRHQLPIIKNANCTVNCDLPFADHRRVFPIPFNEMNTNSLMVQNPSYQ